MSIVDVVAPMVGIDLDLIDVRHQPALEQPGEMGGLEVRDADGAHQTGVEHAEESLHRLGVAVLARIRPMDEEEVEE